MPHGFVCKYLAINQWQCLNQTWVMADVISLSDSRPRLASLSTMTNSLGLKTHLSFQGFLSNFHKMST